MATEDTAIDPFAEFNPETEDTAIDPFAEFNPEGDSAPSAFNVQPLDFKRRLIIQNFFDSNDTARAQYLKELGYEMNPTDTNEVRPIGSKMDFIEIDPGFGDVFKKGGLAAVGQEILQDAGDVGYDMADLGTKALAAIGGAFGGAGLASIPAAMAGAAAAGALSSSVKQNIRDVFTDKDIPFDAKEAAIESAFSAAGAGAGGLISKGARSLKNFSLTKQIDSIKNALKAAGNVTDTELIEKAAKNPEMFTEEAVQGGTRRLYDATKKIFGLEEDEVLRDIKDLKRIRPDSYFGKTIAPMADAQRTAIDALSLDKNANISYQDAMGQLNQTFLGLENKMLQGAPTQVEVEAHKVLKEKIKGLRNMAAANIGVDPKTATAAQLQNVTLNHGQAREFLNSVQDAAFDRTTKNSNPLLKQAAGGMRQYLDGIAMKSDSEFGRMLPELNQKMSTVLDDYNSARQLIGKPEAIMKAYVGGAENSKAFEIKDLMTALDQKYNMGLAKDFEPASAQAVFENIYKGAPAKGSSRVNAYITKETLGGALKGAGAGATVGSLTPVGTVPGLVGGALVGGATAGRNAALIAQPEVGLRKLGGLLEEQGARDLISPADKAIRDALAGGAGAAAGGAMPGATAGKPLQEEDDPFAEFQP